MKHPQGVISILVIQSLERFGYWGFQSLLVLFLIESYGRGGLDWNESQAIAYCGFFSALLYLTPPLGGRVADKYLGSSTSIILGSLLMALGIFTLSLSKARLLTPSLFLIAIGNGLFKPCITALLGHLYGPSHPLREKGYHYLYQAILIGILSSAFVCGWLLPNFGFPVAFIAAGSGSLLATLIFLCMPHSIPSLHPTYQPASKTSPLTILEKQRVTLIFLLALFSIIFFAAHVQGGGLITVYVHRYMQRTLFHREIPTLWLTSCGTILGIIVTPIIAHLWYYLRARSQEPTPLGKFTLGILLSGLSFLFMIGAALQRELSPIHLSSLSWLVGFHLFSITGKLLVIPILWSTVEKIAPLQYKNLLMGTILGSISIGNLIGGQIGGLVKQMECATVFSLLAVMCFVTAFFLSLSSKKIQKNTHVFSPSSDN